MTQSLILHSEDTPTKAEPPEPTYSIDLIDETGESFFALTGIEEPLFNPNNGALQLITSEKKKVTIINPPTSIIMEE